MMDTVGIDTAKGSSAFNDFFDQKSSEISKDSEFEDQKSRECNAGAPVGEE